MSESEIEEVYRVVIRAMDISLMLEKGDYYGIYTERISIGNRVVRMKVDIAGLSIYPKDDDNKEYFSANYYNYRESGNTVVDLEIVDDIIRQMKEKGFNPFDGEEEHVKAVAATEELPF